ncbi:hypothetical protein AVEN_144431-1 [Araneus ventricosus]|uniref:Helitron helicase-like domain-containing protein n=1 Tax=Araneus ventricosus TaxID=182803 RepID=A0A4Y2E0F9_ARAVE|nr:hypothetical protein AVEN_144431-1 [Araneus ventricosus]
MRLPHAHILIWLKEKIRPEDVDNEIRADIPDTQEDPVLLDIVSKHMIHGPCGALNMKSPCMKDKKFTKRYLRKIICTLIAVQNYTGSMKNGQRSNFSKHSILYTPKFQKRENISFL